MLHTSGKVKNTLTTNTTHSLLLPDGIHHWNVSVTDTYDTNTSTTRTLTTDSTPPQLINATCNITHNNTSNTTIILNATNSTISASQADNISCTLQWTDNSLNWSINGLSNATLNTTFSVLQTQTTNITFTGNTTQFNYTNLPAGLILFNLTAYDWLHNANQAIINITSNDTRKPTINSITTTPLTIAGIDPNMNITIHTNITDNLAIHTVLLYYQRNDTYNTTNWTSTPMQGTTLYNTTLTNQSKGNYTYYIWTNDTYNNTIQSQNNILQIWNDYTINISITNTPETAIINENATLGTITFNNTGDFNYTCALPNSTYITSSKDMLFNYNTSNIILNSPPTTKTRQINITPLIPGDLPDYSVSISIPVDCSCLSCTENNEDYVYSTTLTPSIKIIPAGPYFEFTGISSIATTDAGNSQQITTGITNIGNEDAVNLSIFLMNLPSGVSATPEENTESLFSCTSGINYKTQVFTIYVGSGVATGSYCFYLYTNCSNCLQTQNIKEICIPVDGAPTTIIEEHYTGSSSGGSSSGGGSPFSVIITATEKQRQKLFQTDATYELLRGRQQQFNLEVENPFEGALINTTISIKGFLSKYLRIHPTRTDLIPQNNSQNFTIFLEAPEYFTRGEYKLIFTIEGIINTTPTTDMKETRTIKLIILEISRQEAIDIREIEQKNLNTKDLRESLNTANNTLKTKDYEIARDLHAQMQQTKQQAFDCLELLNEIRQKITQAEHDGIDVSKTKRLLLLSQAALDRGDFVSALKRAEDAKVTYALETVGIFNIVAFAKNNWGKIIIATILITILSFFSFLALKLDLITRKLKNLKKEESVLLSLIKEAQRECFIEGKLSMREYMQTLMQYEKRMSKAIQESINAIRINLLSSSLAEPSKSLGLNTTLRTQPISSSLK